MFSISFFHGSTSFGSRVTCWTRCRHGCCCDKESRRPASYNQNHKRVDLKCFCTLHLSLASFVFIFVALVRTQICQLENLEKTKNQTTNKAVNLKSQRKRNIRQQIFKLGPQQTNKSDTMTYNGEQRTIGNQTIELIYLKLQINRK